MTKTSVTETRPEQEIAGVIEIRRQRPMVSSLKIAELFVRPHKNVLASIRKELADEIGRLEIKPTSYADTQGKQQPMFWLNEEQALFIMPFIGGKRAREGQRKLVKAYLYYRDAYANPPRDVLIRAKRDASRQLTDSIIDWRAFEGKDTDARHFMSEQKLCNWAVSGAFGKLDESALSNEDVELLREVREMNASLIAAGVEYKERKTAVARFATRRRTKLLDVSAA